MGMARVLTKRPRRAKQPSVPVEQRALDAYRSITPDERRDSLMRTCAALVWESRRPNPTALAGVLRHSGSTCLIGQMKPAQGTPPDRLSNTVIAELLCLAADEPHRSYQERSYQERRRPSARSTCRLSMA